MVRKYRSRERKGDINSFDDQLSNLKRAFFFERNHMIPKKSRVYPKSRAYKKNGSNMSLLLERNRDVLTCLSPAILWSIINSFKWSFLTASQ